MGYVSIADIFIAPSSFEEKKIAFMLSLVHILEINRSFSAVQGDRSVCY